MFRLIRKSKISNISIRNYNIYSRPVQLGETIVDASPNIINMDTSTSINNIIINKLDNIDKTTRHINNFLLLPNIDKDITMTTDNQMLDYTLKRLDDIEINLMTTKNYITDKKENDNTYTIITCMALCTGSFVIIGLTTISIFIF